MRIMTAAEKISGNILRRLIADNVRKSMDIRCGD